MTSYTLTNSNGMEATILPLGATIAALRVPDRHGKLDDVVLGFDDPNEYLRDSNYMGAVTGRYANRIAGGRFALDGVEYPLARNNGENHIHGGVRGFDKAVWRVLHADDRSLELGYLSPDGEEGYPGNLQVQVLYTLTGDSGLRIDYSASTDKATVINLSNHSYFNLAGQGDVLRHQLTIHAGRFTSVDASLIPTGDLRPVDGTPFDFRKPEAIGARIARDDEQLRIGRGYDHNFVLNQHNGSLVLAASVWEPDTGRVHETYTTEPGLQLYTANHLDGSVIGKRGVRYQRHCGYCLETQHFPDSPNRPEFPPAVVRPGATYRTTTLYRFGSR